MIVTDSSRLIQLLKDTRTIAVVGLSTSPYRASNGVAAYLMRQGYTIIPVNPNYDEVLGLKCYPSLRDIPGPVDMVDVFRNPAEVMPIVEDAIAIGAKSIWFQLDVINEEAIARADQAGLLVVVDRCLKVEHSIHRAALAS
ncbi:MAG TPA: CoA-binding protein [Chloroflexia bacterium]|nr:CoA-binding protein [Chloroflexia bacterium]